MTGIYYQTYVPEHFKGGPMCRMIYRPDRYIDCPYSNFSSRTYNGFSVAKIYYNNYKTYFENFDNSWEIIYTIHTF